MHLVKICLSAWILTSISAFACSAGVLLVRANVISSRSFIRPAMFDLKLDWTVGVGGGGGPREMDEKTPARRGCWKAKHHLISCASLHFQKWASNQSKRVKLKTWSTVFRQKQTHEGPMSGTVRHFIFGRKKKWLRQNLLRGHKYELIFAALFIFRTKILEYSCR